MQYYINKIKDQKIRSNVQEACKNLPGYFWEVAASSSGRYHPKFSLGHGGLVRHTMCALDIASQLFILKQYELSEIQKDIIIASLILHDGMKHGVPGTESYNETWTIKNHDDVMRKWLDDFWSEGFNGRTDIINCVETHMGQWASTRTPETDIEKFVHLCDYLASRKLYDKYYELEVNIQTGPEGTQAEGLKEFDI